MKKFVKGVRFAPKNYSDEVEAKIQHYKREGYKLPSRHLLRTEEQLAGIRESARINTALLDYISENIREGMSTAEIDHMVYCFTTDHDAIPAPFLYEGFPKSVCVSINDVVCHGIPSTKEFLRSGDIVNVDVSTIYKGYFSDASRMYMIGEVSPEMQRLVQVTRECRDIGIQAAQPWARLGDVGAAIQEHAEKNGYSVVRDLCGHGVGIKFHEDADPGNNPGHVPLLDPGALTEDSGDLALLHVDVVRPFQKGVDAGSRFPQTVERADSQQRPGVKSVDQALHHHRAQNAASGRSVPAPPPAAAPGGLAAGRDDRAVGQFIEVVPRVGVGRIDLIQHQNIRFRHGVPHSFQRL